MSLAETGRRMITITMGIDRFERSRNAGACLFDGEEQVPVCLGGDLVEARRYDDWAEINSDIDGLSTDIDALAAGERKTFFEGMLASLKLAVLFSGDEPRLAEKVPRLMDTPAGAVAPAIIETIRDNLDWLLVRAEFTSGSLKDREMALEDQREVCDRVNPEQRSALIDPLYSHVPTPRSLDMLSSE